MPVCSLKSSIATCCGVPLPGELYLIAPGFAFASATNSWAFFTGTAAFVTSTMLPVATRQIGAKLFTGSNGSAGYIAGVIASVVTFSISV